MAVTVVVSSESTLAVQPIHWCLQIATPKTTGINSLLEMWAWAYPSQLKPRSSMIDSTYPSEVKVVWRGASTIAPNMATPFHAMANWNHNSISEWASTLSLTKKSELVDKSMRRCRNALLACATLLAWERVPMRDRSSLLIHEVLLHQWWRASWRSGSLSAGSLIWRGIVSIPKKVKVVTGPIVFSGVPMESLPPCRLLACAVC